MLTNSIPAEEQQIVREAIMAVLLSPDIPVEDYLTRYAISHERMRSLLRQWPACAPDDENDVNAMVLGCLCEVCYGIAFDSDDPDVAGMPAEDWPKWFSVSRAKVQMVFDSLKEKANKAC